MNNGYILIAVILLVIAAVAWRYYPQSAMEQGSGDPIVKVTIPELDAETQVGKSEFDENCASCHGANAAGQEGIAPPLVHRIYEPDHHGDQSFYLAAKQGVRAHHWPFGNMPPVEGITDEQISQIIVYIRALQRANGII